MPPFLSQAAPRFPGNANVSQGIVALGGAVGKAIKSYQTARAEREIGQALQTGGLPAVQEAAARHGRPDLALKINQIIASRGRASQVAADRAQDREFKLEDREFAQEDREFAQEDRDFRLADRQTGLDRRAALEAATNSFLAGRDVPEDQRALFAQNPAALKSVLPQEAPKSEKLDLGDSFAFVDPKTGEIKSTIPKNVRRAAKEKSLGVAEGKAEVKLAAGSRKAASTLKSLESSWKVVDGAITQSLKNIDWTNTGLLSPVARAFPGSQAFDLAKTLDTIKANIGFDKLQSMRDNSPTGGALGQVSNLEIMLLQAVQGSLDQNQSPTQLRQNLQQIQTLLGELQQDRRSAFESTYLQKRPSRRAPARRGAAPARGKTATDPRTGQKVFQNLKTGQWEAVQ